MANRKPNRNGINTIESPQGVLFDKNGFAPFNPLTEAFPVEGQPGWFKVGEMVTALHPDPSDLLAALKLTMDGITLLHNSKSSRTYRRPMLPGPMTLDSWACRKCTVTFRDHLDDGVIHATYTRSDGHLALSIPHMAIWKTCGLGWLWADADNCHCNAENPTPWCRRQCGCK